MSFDYWLGVATPTAIALAGWLWWKFLHPSYTGRCVLCKQVYKPWLTPQWSWYALMWLHLVTHPRCHDVVTTRAGRTWWMMPRIPLRQSSLPPKVEPLAVRLPMPHDPKDDS